MEALNNQTQIDEFNIESFHGGLECNIEEVTFITKIIVDKKKL